MRDYQLYIQRGSYYGYRRETDRKKKDTEFTGYDVPLSIDLQQKIKIICDDYEIDMALILAMIKYESSFDPGVMGDGQESFGLMQIQPKWHEDRMRRLGVTDLLDPEQNVRVGADLLSELLSKEKRDGVGADGL